ncbi:MAG: PilZ domain-containing protein [Boseongicola sp.]|nr:PilZ domain-containing protein [Boseongicola sp.]
MTRATTAHRFSHLLALACLASPPAYACTASDQLSGLGQSYESLLKSGSQSTCQDEATRLTQSLTATGAASLGGDLGTEGAPADISRIARLFADASALLNSTWSDRDRHTNRALENLSYIDRMLKATGCQSGETITAQAETAQSEPPITKPETPKRARSATTKLLVGLVVFTLALSLVAAVAYLLRSRRVPTSRTERLKRYPAVIPVMITTADAPPELIETADISRGGVRLSWTNAPPEGTPLTIDFSVVECSAHIIWSNTYFAGVRLDTPLSDEELTKIRNRNNNA